MEKALSLATLSFLVLGLAACNDSNNITGINAGKTSFASTPTPTPASSEAGHKVVVLAPNQPPPRPHARGGTPTPTPTPNSHL